MPRLKLKTVATALAVLAAGALGVLAQKASVKLWEVSTGHVVQSSPALAADGTIYVGCDNGRIYSVTREGKVRWYFPTGGSVIATPAIGPDGTIYAASTDGCLYALDADGTEKFRLATGDSITGSPAIGADGTIYFGTVMSNVFAVFPDGHVAWGLNAGGGVVSSPAIAEDGTIYVGLLNGKLLAIQSEGLKKWEFAAGGKINSSPAIGADGTIYFGAHDGLVYAITSEGKKRWTYKTDDAVRSSPAVGADGTIYIGSDDRKLHAIAPDGSRRWTFQTGNWVRSSPAVGTDGTIFVGSYDGKFYAVGPDGKSRWFIETASHVTSSPVIASDGTIYVGSWDKNLYAFRGGETLASTSWPKFRGPLASRPGLAGMPPVTVKPPAPVATTEQSPAVKPDTKQSAAQPSPAGTPTLTPATPNVTSAKPAISVPETPLPAVPAVTSAPPVVVVTPVPLPPVKSVTISTSAPPILSDTKPTTPQVLPSGLVVTAPTQAPGVTSAKPGISAPEKPLTSVMTNNVTVTSPTLPATTNITAKPVADTASLLQSYPPGIEKRLLIVDTNGIGRVLPETGGMAWLAVGRTVTLVAEPGIGHRFTGWSGSIVASTPTVTFTMRSNVVLMANFVPFDSISVPAPVPTPAPTVALQPAPIPIPAPATVVTSPPPSVPVFTPREMVPEPTVTTRTTTPGKGPQELRMVLLTLETTGAGTISPKWNGRLLEVGKTYALVAEPGRGQVFAGWSGDMESASQRITFTPRANTRLVANFVPVTAARPTQTPKVATQTAPAPTVTPPQPTPTPVAPAPATVPPRMVAQPTASATTVPPVPAFTSTATLQPSPIPPIEVPARPVVTPPPVETVPSPVPTAPIPAAIAQAVPPPGPMPIAPAPVVPAETLTTTAKAAEAAPVKTSKMPHWIQRLIYLNPPYKQEESQRVAKMTGVTPAEAVESAPKPRGKSLPNAPMGLLALDTTGAGRIVPIAASQFLEVGKTYTLTAVPDLGSEFTGWSGDIETNKATITFMMRSTIALQANFRPGAGPLAVAPTPTPGPPQVLTPPAVTAPAPPLTSTQGMRLPSGLLLPPQQLPVLSRFTLETNGQGRVTPDYGGKYLDLGRAYTLTAEPSPGWEFLGWTGGANSSSARIQFIMESNMVLRANFARVTMEDRVRPAVAIFSPTEGERVRDSVVTVRGVASDNVAVARVEYQAGSADFRVADGTTNWIARVPAAPGTNTIVVRAVDTAGNESVLVSRSFIYVQYSLFTLRARGQGRVVPDLNGKLLEVGHTYMLTAEPSPGWQFAGWVDGINPEKQTLNFVMQPDLVMEARFEPKAAPLAVMTNAPPVEPFVYHPPGDTFAGRYNGLFYNTNALAPTSAGYFIVTVTESGTFYGRLDLGEQSFPLSGRLDAQGRAQQTIQAQGRTAMLLSFQTDARGDQLTGQLKDDTFTAQLFGDRQAFDGKALASVAAGSYTLVIPGHTNVAAPVGDGFGTVTVDATGRLSFRGELADGTPVSQEAILSKAGVWPLHVPLYQGRGALMGWVTITNGAPVDLYGQVHWFKPPAKDDRYYPAGFSTRVYMFGSSYMVPAGQRDVTARLTGLMRGGNLDEQVMENISIGVDNRPAPVKGNSAFVLTLASNNGTLSGNFLHPVTRRATPFKGVLLQKQNWASGYFLGTNQSGMVFLRAQPEQ